MRVILDETPFQRLTGYRIEIPPGGVPVVVLTVREAILNRSGVVHGGMLASLLDTACGWRVSHAADPEALPPAVTLSLVTNFLAPVTAGTLRATAELTGGGRRTRFVEGRLTADGALAATASAVMRLRD